VYKIAFTIYDYKLHLLPIFAPNCKRFLLTLRTRPPCTQLLRYFFVWDCWFNW